MRLSNVMPNLIYEINANTKIQRVIFLMLLLNDIFKLSRDLNIYNYCHIYREANRATNCLIKKGIYNRESII